MRGLQGGILAGATALALGLAPLGTAIGADGLGDGTASVDCVPSMMESLVPAPTEREEGPSGGVSGELMESSGRTKSTTRATLKAQLKKRKRVAIIVSVAIVALLALILMFVIIKKRGKANKKKKEKLDEENKANTETIVRPETASANYIEDYLKNQLDQVTVSTEGLKEFLEMFNLPVNAANIKFGKDPGEAWNPLGSSGRIQVLSDKKQHGRDALATPGKKSLLYQTLYASMATDRNFSGTDMCRTQATDGGCLWYITSLDPKNSPDEGQWTVADIDTKLKIIKEALSKETRSVEDLAAIQENADVGVWDAKKAGLGAETRPLYGNIVKEASARTQLARWAAKQDASKLGAMIDREDFRCRHWGRPGDIGSAENDHPVADLALRLQFKKQLDESHENVGVRALHEAWSGAQKFGSEIEEQVKTGVRLQGEYESAVKAGKTANEIMQVATHEYRQWHEIHEYGSVTAMALEAEMRVAQKASDVFRRLAIQAIQANAAAHQASGSKRKSKSGTIKAFGGGSKPKPVQVSIPAILNKTSYGLADIDNLAGLQKGAAVNMAQEAAFQLFKAHLLKAKLSYVSHVMAEVNKKAETTLTGRYNTVFKA